MMRGKQINEDRMLFSLNALLTDGESLCCTIHAAMLLKNTYAVGFFGLTHKHLLIALPKVGTRTIEMTAKFPLEVQVFKVKKSLISRQTLMTITFRDGTVCRIRAAKRVYGIPNQSANLARFINILNDKTACCQ